MKKLFLLAFLSASVVGMMQSCGSDSPSTGAAPLTVTKTQRSLLIYNTATWCGPCGQYGSGQFKTALAARDANSLVSLDLHSSSGSYLVPTFVKNDTVFIAQFAVALYGQTKPNGSIPHFYMNNSSLGSTCASAPGSADDYNAAVPVEVGVGANASLSGNKITVNYKLQAYAPEAGAKYYTSVIICEKEIGCYQLGAPGTFATHKHIIRASAHKNAAGTQLAFSESAILDNPIKDAVTEKTATFDYVATPDKLVTQINTATQGTTGFDFGWWKLNKANTGVAVIVWKYISPTEMFYVNTVWADVK
jgi:hypothetical protein